RTDAPAFASMWLLAADFIPSGLKLDDDLAVAELAGDAIGHVDPSLERVAVAFQVGRYATLRDEHLRLRPLQRPQVGLNDQPVRSQPDGAYAKDRRAHMVDRMRPPGMAIRPRRLGGFQAGFQPQFMQLE